MANLRKPSKKETPTPQRDKWVTKLQNNLINVETGKTAAHYAKEIQASRAERKQIAKNESVVFWDKIQAVAHHGNTETGQAVIKEMLKDLAGVEEMWKKQFYQNADRIMEKVTEIMAIQMIENGFSEFIAQLAEDSIGGNPSARLGKQVTANDIEILSKTINQRPWPEGKTGDDRWGHFVEQSLFGLAQDNYPASDLFIKQTLGAFDKKKNLMIELKHTMQSYDAAGDPIHVGDFAVNPNVDMVTMASMKLLAKMQNFLHFRSVGSNKGKEFTTPITRVMFFSILIYEAILEDLNAIKNGGKGKYIVVTQTKTNSEVEYDGKEKIKGLGYKIEINTTALYSTNHEQKLYRYKIEILNGSKEEKQEFFKYVSRMRRELNGGK